MIRPDNALAKVVLECFVCRQLVRAKQGVAWLFVPPRSFALVHPACVGATARFAATGGCS